MPAKPADRHRAIAERFTAVVDGVVDWDAPTPVKEWKARDVVKHLIDWLPGFLAAGSDVQLPAGPDPAKDPALAWKHRMIAVQALLDDEAGASAPIETPHTPAMPLGQAIDQFYVSDVAMHTWDLARSSGPNDEMDARLVEDMVAGMDEMEGMIRGSGQFGERVDVPANASPQDRLVGFIGRDPQWRPA